MDVILVVSFRRHAIAVHAVGALSRLHGRERREGSLHRRTRCRKVLLEVRIHERRDRVYRAEVADQPQHGALLRHPPLHHLVRLDIGAAEAVDALLRVAHHEERSGPECHAPPVNAFGGIRREQEADFRLDRIGVLELIHQQVAEPLAQHATCARAGTQQVRSAQQEVAEAKGTGTKPFPAEGISSLPEKRHHRVITVLAPAGEQRRYVLGKEARPFLGQRLGRLLVVPAILGDAAAPAAERSERRSKRGQVIPLLRTLPEAQPAAGTLQVVVAVLRLLFREHPAASREQLDQAPAAR